MGSDRTNEEQRKFKRSWICTQNLCKTESEDTQKLALRSCHSEAVCTDSRSQSLRVEVRTTEACTLLQKLQSKVHGCQHQQRTKVRSQYNHYPNTPCALYVHYSCCLWERNVFFFNKERIQTLTIWYIPKSSNGLRMIDQASPTTLNG